LTGANDQDDSRAAPRRDLEADRDADGPPRSRLNYNDQRDDFDEEFLRTPASIARERLFVPAIAILLIGVLGVLGMFALTVVALLDFMNSRQSDKQVIILVICLWAICLGLCVFGFVIAGAVSMLRLRRYGLAFTAAYIVTGLSLAGLYGILFYPFGIWALILLYRPEIRREFRRLAARVDD
jgi:hypothetical protein